MGLKGYRVLMALLAKLEARVQMVQPVDPVISVLLGHRDLEGTLEVQDHLEREETLGCQVHQERTDHLERLVPLGTRAQQVEPEQLDCKGQQVERVKEEILVLEGRMEVLDLRAKEEIPASRVPKELRDLEGPQAHQEM